MNLISPWKKSTLSIRGRRGKYKANKKPFLSLSRAKQQRKLLGRERTGDTRQFPLKHRNRFASLFLWSREPAVLLYLFPFPRTNKRWSELERRRRTQTVYFRTTLFSCALQFTRMHCVFAYLNTQNSWSRWNRKRTISERVNNNSRTMSHCSSAMRNPSRFLFARRQHT